MAVNKVEINGETKLDLTQDTVTPETLLAGATAHNAAGEQIEGAVSVAPASNTTPKAPGTAEVGTEQAYARGDHVHPREVKTYTASIGTSWTEDSDTGVKTQSVAIPGVLASHTAKVDHAYTGSGTSDDYAAFVEAENQYLTYITNGFAETYNGGVKFTIFGEAPTVSIPIVVEVA